MDRKDIENMLLNQPVKAGKKNPKIATSAPRADGNSSSSNKNNAEDAMIAALDMRHTLKKHADWIEKLRDGKIDVGQFLSSVSPDVAIEILDLAMTGSEKTKLAAAQDILDRAGHGKINKHAIASVDPNQPKEHLLSMIMGLNKKSGVIEIEDDDGKDQDQEK